MAIHYSKLILLKYDLYYTFEMKSLSERLIKVFVALFNRFSNFYIIMAFCINSNELMYFDNLKNLVLIYFNRFLYSILYIYYLILYYIISF